MAECSTGSNLGIPISVRNPGCGSACNLFITERVKKPNGCCEPHCILYWNWIVIVIMWLRIKIPLFAENIRMLTFCLSILIFFYIICHQISPRLKNTNQIESQTDGYLCSYNEIILGKTWLGVIPKFPILLTLPIKGQHTHKKIPFH